MKIKTIQTISTILIILLISIYFKIELKGILGSLTMQFSLYFNNYFFLSLFSTDGFTKLNNLLPSLNMGNNNLLQLKFIYILRYLLKEQFLYENKVQIILKNIENNLIKQFQENNWNYNQFDNIPVPTYDWNNITSKEFHQNFVIPGIPVIIKNFPSKAKDLWTPEFFSNNYGEHEIEVANTNILSTLRMNISRYFEAHGPKVFLFIIINYHYHFYSNNN